MSDAAGVGALQSLNQSLALTQGKGASSVEEATESPATRQSEQSGGGIPFASGAAPVSYSAVGVAASPATSGGFSKLV